MRIYTNRNFILPNDYESDNAQSIERECIMKQTIVKTDGRHLKR